jgi:hypothetical protein
MARPKQKLKRDRQFNVAVTAHELEMLHARAAARGMRPVDYGRARLFAERRTTEVHAAGAPHLDPLFLTHLSRLGNNLNQIARRLNTVGQPAPPTLEPLLREIRALLSRRAWGGS